MSDCGISIRLLLAIFLLLLMNYSCVQSIAEPESKKIEILNTSIELDQFKNELYLQIETNQNYSQNFIHEVFMELTYIGDIVHDYSKTFKLYDNGENGELISSNGIYTLLTHADTIILPDIEPEIKNIDMAEYFMLDETDPDSLDISITINGKAFQCLASVLDIFNENLQLNHIEKNIHYYHHDVLTWEYFNYDIILANINCNIIEELIPKLKGTKAQVILSGLLNTDDKTIEQICIKQNFQVKEKMIKEEWICIELCSL